MITLPILDLLLALVASVPAVHPHNPMAITFSGAQGKATLSVRTLPFNPDTVAAGGNFSWLGAITSEMDLMVGDVNVPAGAYSLNVPAAAGSAFTEAVFAVRGGDSITVPITAFEAPEREHKDLEVVLINKGFTTTGMRSTTPSAGATFVMKLSFGDINRQLELKEVFKSDG